MEVGKDESFFLLQEELGISPFEQRFPWIGGDLQTLRDTFISEGLPNENGKAIQIEVPSLPNGRASKGHLLILLDLPTSSSQPCGVVLLLHGLGGSSRRLGLRRMAFALLNAGFAVLRVNLRGADPGRHLAGGTYAAECNSDLGPVIIYARELCNVLSKQFHSPRPSLPLFGAGISLGGTMLLNACLQVKQKDKPLLDGLVCTSSPLDLQACSSSIERPRNRVYQRWLLKRLIRQTLADPFGVHDCEKEFLLTSSKNSALKTIRSFDAAITAPRWGYKDVDDYYKKASPLLKICEECRALPPLLFLQALDDPWVPAEGAKKIAESIVVKNLTRFQVVLTKNGGHNGFHGIKGCWGDLLVKRWLLKLSKYYFNS
ncbi:YheT family hydrolase [Prochlorococcus sp. MIT 1307]|uniref:YheT family hydrolase n=1 Tax=Prochlorococcus sp. MIT 1307 TaxID=3096219 RepID=UPI002A7662CA|nr:alpha/beta fold hydrolase [Prochlorococcus sp. MIT 1307]